MLTTTQWIIVFAVLAVVAIALIALINARITGRRHAQLQHRFGPEYSRAVEEQGSVARAERELAARAKRIETLELRTLPEAERVHFNSQWQQVQARFVDDPSQAVQAADDLIKTVMIARGYPMERFEQRVVDLSVAHANVVEHYRAARVLAEANRQGHADTEQLRQAVVHYRELFADLLDESQRSTHQMQEVHV